MYLQIYHPCHENWAEMLPNAEGRFCQNCQKVVIDFSKMTDNEINNYFLQRENEKICGRFKPSQLNRNIGEQMPINASNRYPAWKYMVFTALALGTLTGCSFQQAQIEQANVNTELNDYLDKWEKAKEKAIEDAPDILISGIILAPNTTSDIKILVKDTNMVVKPNTTLNFQFYLPAKWVHKDIELLISSADYQDIHHTIPAGDHDVLIRVDMEKGTVDAQRRRHITGEFVPHYPR